MEPLTEITPDQLEAYLKDYVNDLRDDGKSESTVTQKQRVCQNLINYIRAGETNPDGDDERPRVLDTERKYDSANTLRNFFLESEQTIAKPYLYHVRGFLKYISGHLGDVEDQDRLLNIRDMLTTERFPNGTFDSKEPEPPYISDADIVRACQRATTPRAELVIRFLYWTGCRIGEMRAVTVDDIDFDTDVTGAAVRISKQKTEDGEIVPPKTAAGDRTVELPDQAAELLQGYIDRNDLSGDDEVFPMSVDTYRRTDVKQAFTRAGVLVEDGTSQVKPHWLRHQRNTRLRERYQDSKVARYMGHSRSGDGEGSGSGMTDHYTHYDPAQVQGLLDKGWVLE